MGGPGTIDYFPLTMALVVNQTPDIQEQIQDLLASLRRLQDQEVAIEIRFITITDDFYERIGVDFSMNILTDKETSRFEPSILTGNFKPAGQINQFSPKRFIAGLTGAGTFTPDLDIPIRPNSYQGAFPSFGGYQGPGVGGLAVGLAFLSEIQVFLFLEATQGDVRQNIMQAPKLTMFNGQTATLTVADFQNFVTGIQINPNLNGQVAFLPNITQLQIGTSITVQPVITADRRFVRMSLTPTLTNFASATVALFPVVVPIFSLINGVQTGQPIVFTQFIQTPVTTAISVNTTVSVPDGGTVLLGGLKRMSEERKEFGPPVLSKIPYLNRLFKNTSYGRDTHSLMLMVTPRIIVQEEEEIRQTGFSVAPPTQ
jgi:type II secretory pathway component GspD/PulD (secretin)